MTTPLLSRARVLLALTALAATALTGCDVGTDSLGATGDHRAVRAGAPITGTVDHAGGAITVTLAGATVPPPEAGSHSPGSLACAYADGAFSCPSDDLPVGGYRVEVTDTGSPDDTRLVSVVVTDVEGYDPQVAVGEDPRQVVLTGWEPGRPVTLEIVDDDEARHVGSPVTGTPDAQGAVTLRIGSLEHGRYQLDASDGRWSTGTVDGWDRVVVEL